MNKSLPTFGGFSLLPGNIDHPIDIPLGHSLHLSGASILPTADTSTDTTGRCILSINRTKSYRGEPAGIFPIACLSTGRFESVRKREDSPSNIRDRVKVRVRVS